MVKSINIIRRIGSKQTDIKYFSDFLPDSKKIVEPFGGSFAVSKFFYKDVNKYNFHINDLDYILYYIYTHYEDYLHFLHIINEHGKTLEGKFNGKVIEEYINSLNCDTNVKIYLIKNFIVKNYIYRGYLTNNFDENERLILKNALFTNLDYKAVFDKYKNDEDAFLFLDPPYLFSDNSSYHPQNENNDMTMILIDILDYLKYCKCKVMLVINKLNIIEYLFKEYIKCEYLKTYQISKKKMKHLVITNYD